MTTFLLIALVTAIITGWFILFLYLLDSERWALAAAVFVLGISIFATLLYKSTDDDPPCARYDDPVLIKGVWYRSCAERYEKVPGQ